MKGVEKAKGAREGSLDKHTPKELDLEILNEMYENFIKKEEYLTGVLNTKSLSQKNIDLKSKIKAWVEAGDYIQKTNEWLAEKE